MTTLAEAVLLLADNNRGGRFDSVDRNAAAVGAVLADLALAGRITLDAGLIRVTDATPTGDASADRVLAAIVADKPRKPAAWITKLYWGFPNRVRDDMARRGVLHRRTSSVFKVRSYSPTDPALEAEIRDRLGAAVAAGTTPDAWVAELAALVSGLGMYRNALPDLPVARAREGVDAIAAPGWTSAAVRQAVQYNRIALFTAMIPIFVVIIIAATR